MLSVQDVIFTLNKYWSQQGCVILQGYDLPMGAGTFHPATVLRVMDSKPWYAAFVQPSRRPTDGRYGNNPNRIYRHHQYQVLLKPSPENIQELYLGSIKALGLDPKSYDIRFVEDNWESPTLGASGYGYEVWCNGMEITQFTYFQQVAGYNCKLITAELTYGLERLCMFLQNQDNVYNLMWNQPTDPYPLTYGDMFKFCEYEWSKYSFEDANIEILFEMFEKTKKECLNLLEKNLILPSYEQCIVASHLFNTLDARGAISVNERAFYISVIRDLAKKCVALYMHQDNKLEK